MKSKYFINGKTFIETKRRFGEKYGDGMSDEYLSDLFGAEVNPFQRYNQNQRSFFPHRIRIYNKDVTAYRKHKEIGQMTIFEINDPFKQ